MKNDDRKLYVADLFCGAGGASAGLAKACETMGLDVDLIAINHWELAIQSHQNNFPWARHLCQNLDAVDPTKAVPGGRLDLMIAAPECTHHSTARGGRPVDDQLRTSAWHVCRWAERLHVESILIENVPEFRNWGPLIPKLNKNGKEVLDPKTGLVKMVPDPLRKGETFKAFIQALQSLGYTVEYRVLNAADYGDATTRRRLFIMCRKGDKLIHWPKQTHAKDGAGGLKPHRPAREVIDFSDLGVSIFNREEAGLPPLAKKTLARIDAGLKKYCGLEPFLLKLYGTGKTADIGQALPTVTANGQHIALVNFLLAHRQFDQDLVDSVDKPMRTITGKSSDMKAVQIKTLGLTEEAKQILASYMKNLPDLKPFLSPQFGERKGQEPRTHSVDDPAPAVTSHGAGALVQPKSMVVTLNHGGGENRIKSVDDTLHTITTKNNQALVTLQPFLVKYYRTGTAVSIDEPMDTITTKPRFALCVPIGDGKHGIVIDIFLRMLKVSELAAAMSFPTSYKFAGKKTAQIKQIGNAWPCKLAKALCCSLLAHVPGISKKQRRAGA